MTTKLAAARIATASGITVHLADGRNLERLDVATGRGGTVFHPSSQPLGTAAVGWPMFCSQRALQLDQVPAPLKTRCSLLLVGVQG